MINITSDSYWYVGWPFVFDSTIFYVHHGVYFPNGGRYNTYFGANSRTGILNYTGPSLEGTRLTIATNAPGIIIYYSSITDENSGWWGSNEGYDVDFIEAIDGYASIIINRPFYGIGALCVIDNDGYLVDDLVINLISYDEKIVDITLTFTCPEITEIGANYSSFFPARFTNGTNDIFAFETGGDFFYGELPPVDTGVSISQEVYNILESNATFLELQSQWYMDDSYGVEIKVTVNNVEYKIGEGVITGEDVVNIPIHWPNTQNLQWKSFINTAEKTL